MAEPDGSPVIIGVSLSAVEAEPTRSIRSLWACRRSSQPYAGQAEKDKEDQVVEGEERHWAKMWRSPQTRRRSGHHHHQRRHHRRALKSHRPNRCRQTRSFLVVPQCHVASHGQQPVVLAPAPRVTRPLDWTLLAVQTRWSDTSVPGRADAMNPPPPPLEFESYHQLSSQKSLGRTAPRHPAIPTMIPAPQTTISLLVQTNSNRLGPHSKDGGHAPSRLSCHPLHCHQTRLLLAPLASPF